MKCGRDDMANCCGKCNKEDMKIIAVIPVHGRRPLIKHTIERLYRKNGVYKVICIGDQPKDERTCKAAGAEWAQHANKPLGSKWNAGFIEAKKHKPDGCLFVGSSDWVSDNWLQVLVPEYLDKFDMIGLPGCYLLDIQSARKTFRAVHWPGYIGPREGESIGIGRIISARILEKMNWQPFEALEHSLDYSMVKRVMKAGGKIKLVHTDKIQSMAISCNEWPNKHNFESHWNNRLPSERIDPKETVLKWFPEALEIFKP